MRPVLASLSTDLRKEAPFLRQCLITSNYVELVAWPQLLKKVGIVTRISIESSVEGRRVWVGVESQPLVAPDVVGTKVYLVTPPGLRGLLGAPFDLARETDASGHCPRITQSANRRIQKVTKALPDLEACARDLEPDKWEDGTWCTDAEAKAYCLAELGRGTEAAAVLQGIVDGRPSQPLDPEESEVWDVVQARAARSLEQLARPGKLEQQLDEWAQDRLRSLGIDPFANEFRPLWH